MTPPEREPEGPPRAIVGLTVGLILAGVFWAVVVVCLWRRVPLW